MFKARPTDKLGTMKSCCYLISCLNWFRHWCCAHTWSTYMYVGVPCASLCHFTILFCHWSLCDSKLPHKWHLLCCFPHHMHNSTNCSLSALLEHMQTICFQPPAREVTISTCKTVEFDLSRISFDAHYHKIATIVLISCRPIFLAKTTFSQKSGLSRPFNDWSSGDMVYLTKFPMTAIHSTEHCCMHLRYLSASVINPPH